jgi:hypothetical protein
MISGYSASGNGDDDDRPLESLTLNLGSQPHPCENLR